MFTSKERAIVQDVSYIIIRSYFHTAFAQEVHLCPNCSLLYNDIPFKKDFKTQLRYNGRHEDGISFTEEWYGAHQITAVITYYFLKKEMIESASGKTQRV